MPCLLQVHYQRRRKCNALDFLVVKPQFLNKRLSYWLRTSWINNALPTTIHLHPPNLPQKPLPRHPRHNYQTPPSPPPGEHIQCNSQGQCQQVTTCANDPSIAVGSYVLPSPSLPLSDSPYIPRTITPILSSSSTSRIPTTLPKTL